MKPLSTAQLPLGAQKSLGFRVWTGEPGVMHRAHQHADIELNFLFAGSLEYFIAGKRTIVPARRLSALWGGVPHAVLYSEEATVCSWTTVPLAWFLGWGLPQALDRRLLQGDLVVEAEERMGARDEQQQREWAELCASTSPEHLKIVRLEIEARVRRLALSSTPPDASAKPTALDDEASTLAERIADVVGARYTQRLTIEAVAAAVGTTPNHAMRVFKKSWGMSIGDYLTGVRVSQAQRLLMETDLKILDVALRSGFGSSSRFYDAFVAAVGQTPSVYRAMLGRESDG
jgi:AraC-like DNA-binding protein